MHDITNFVFNKIRVAVLALYENTVVSKTYQPTASTFPYVTFIDIEDSEIEHTLDYTERKSRKSWQIDIYMTGGTRESVAKKIAAAISGVMENDLHMKRISAKPVTNAADTTIYRYSMVYTCNFDEERRLIYS